jgi:hypothetical protein
MTAAHWHWLPNQETFQGLIISRSTDRGGLRRRRIKKRLSLFPGFHGASWRKVSRRYLSGGDTLSETSVQICNFAVRYGRGKEDGVEEDEVLSSERALGGTPLS